MLKIGRTYKVNKSTLITIMAIEECKRPCPQCGEVHRVIIGTKGQRLLDTGSFVDHINWDTPTQVNNG